MSRGARYLFISVSTFALVNVCAKLLIGIPFQELAFWRSLIGLFICLSFLRAQGTRPWGKNKKLLLLRGSAGTVALTLFLYTLHTMPLASAVTIQYLAPIFTVLIARIFFGETTRLLHWLCSLLGFAGVWLIEGFDTRVDLFDASMGVLSALCSGLAYNSVRSLRHSDNEWVVIFYFQLICVTVTAPFAAQVWVWPQGTQWLVILALGGLTQLAQLYLTKAYHTENAAKLAPINYIGVLYALALGGLLFNESLPPLALAGIALIVGSVWLSGPGADYVKARL